MKSTVRVLIPALLLVWAQANDKEAECKGLKKTIHPDQLHTVEGPWVLVWAVSDGPKGQALIPNVTSQHLTLRLLDNKTLYYNEDNFYRAQKWNCSHFVLNATVVDGNDDDDFKLESDGGIAEFEGKEGPLPDNVTLSFHPSCAHCLHMVYRSNNWDNFLLIYRREGHHTDVEQMEKESGLKRAECLGFPAEPAFVYDGHSEFCQKTSPPANAES